MTTDNAAPAGSRSGLVRTIAVWVVSVLLAALFALAGFMKFISPEAANGFAAVGYPYWFCILIGVIEVVGAAALLVPRTAFYAAVALGVVMVGAVFTMLVHGPAAQAVVPFVVLVLLVLVGYQRRPRFAK